MIVNASEQIQAGGMRWLLPQRKTCHYIWNKLLRISITTLKYHREEHTSKFYLIQFGSSWFNSRAARAEAANKACQALILLQELFQTLQFHKSEEKKKKPSPPAKLIGACMRSENWSIFHHNKVFWKQRKQLGKVCFPNLQAADTTEKHNFLEAAPWKVHVAWHVFH